MINFDYFCLPALYVKDNSSDVIYMVGTDAHGNIQYSNLQNRGGTPQLISQGANDFSHLGEWHFLFVCF